MVLNSGETAGRENKQIQEMSSRQHSNTENETAPYWGPR